MPNPTISRLRPDTPRKLRRLHVVVGGFFLLSGFVEVNTMSPLVSEALAQQHIHSGHAPQQPFGPLLDGSEHPALIPDEVAIRALMQTLRVPPNPDTSALEQLHARVDRVDLSGTDLEILVHQLGVLDTQAKVQEAQILAVRPSVGEMDRAAITHYVNERKRLESLIVDHYYELLASLSTEGAEKLEDHLLHVKSRIRIYPTPDMSGNAK